MDVTALAQAFVTLFVIIDPIAVAPLFMSLTVGMSRPQRRASAFRAIGIAFGVLTVFGLFGEGLLAFSGISLDAFRISGGVLLFLIAVEMLFEKRTSRRSSHAQDRLGDHHETPAEPEHDDDPAVFPIAVPLIAGPGAMATMVLLASQKPGVGWLISVHAVMAAVLAVTLLAFFAASRLDRVIGRSGINVLTRLFGILLAALAVQIVLDGLGGFGLTPVRGDAAV